MKITHTIRQNKYTLHYPARYLNGEQLNFNSYIVVDPEVTSNCQLYVISCAYAMMGLTQEETKELLFYINSTITPKRMLLIDLQKTYLSQFKKQFAPFMNYIKVSHYKSSNGSNMCIIVSQINKSALTD